MLTKSLKLVRSLISGEHPEAMQTESGSASGCHWPWLAIVTLLIQIFYYRTHFSLWATKANRLGNETTKTTSKTDHTSAEQSVRGELAVSEQLAVCKSIDLHNKHQQKFVIKNQRNCCWHCGRPGFQHHHQNHNSPFQLEYIASWYEHVAGEDK